MKNIKLFEDFINEANEEQEVAYMAPRNRASLQKYNEKIAKIISDDGDNLTIKFEDGKQLSEVPKTQVRYLGSK
jgi:hypothetical protein